MTTSAWVDNVLADVTHAARSLRRSPGFAVVAILALAIGIGGNTAIFSVVDATRTQAIPYRDPQQLMYLIGTVERATVERRGASYPDFLDWRAQVTHFEDLAAFDSQLMTLAGTDESERIGTEFVSASYFSLLGVSPALGRVFGADEDDVAKPVAVVVLSDGLWRRRFGADPQVVGQPITLNGQPFTVLGVMTPGFTGVTDEAQLWIPFAQYAPQPAMHERGSRGFNVLGRLEQGATRAAAQAELDTIASRLQQEYPKTNEGTRYRIEPDGDRDLRSTATRAAGADGCDRSRPADRLCKRRELAHCPVRSTAPRDCAARRDRRRARAPPATARHGKLRPDADRRGSWAPHGAGDDRPARHAEPGDVSEHRDAWTRCPRGGIYDRGVAHLRRVRRTRAVVADSVRRSRQPTSRVVSKQRRSGLPGTSTQSRRRGSGARRRAARWRQFDDSVRAQDGRDRSGIRSRVAAHGARQRASGPASDG